MGKMVTSSRNGMSKNWLVTACLAVLLGGCASHEFQSIDRPVVRLAPTSSAAASGHANAAAGSELPADHQVSPGENLYAISLKYSLDYRRLAAANGIEPPYTIYPGQRLQVAKAATTTPARSSVANTNSAVAVANSTATPASRPASDSSAGANPSPTRQNTAANPGTVRPASPPPGVTNGNWFWPHSGAAARPAGALASTRSGIDIDGRRGDPVLAAQDGQVVFAGSGLRGYGNLIIVQHSANWLSAYAHLSRIDVAEQQRVKAGDKIAEMGEREGKAVLHFEIRQDGKAVDPLGLLPRR